MRRSQPLNNQMEYSSLGNTNLKVSCLALGTVELGMDYGFRNSTHYKRPDADQAIRIVDRSLDLGINFIDTARGYGESEIILGRALRGKRDRVVIASKVAIDENCLNDSERLRLAIEESIENSLRALQVDTIDLLQIHNAHRKILTNDVVLGTLSKAQAKGTFRFLGASCVGEESALAALEFSQVRAMMIPLNMLDRQMIPRVFPMAESQGVGLLARSAFLRGVLTDQLADVPDALLPVKLAAARIVADFAGETQNLSELALRYCLSFDAVSTVVIGVRSLEELDANVSAAEKGVLSADTIRRLSVIEVDDSDLVTPGTWQGLI
jgi:1-deoxyxylulose-5-phosphate synthase